MHSLYSNLTCLILCVALSGCIALEQQPQSQLFSDTESLQTATQLLTKEIRLNEIVAACRNSTPETSKLANATLKRWHDDLWTYVAAADLFYLEYIKDQQTHLGEINGQLDALLLKMEAKESNKERISELLAQANFNSDECQYFLQDFQYQEERDLLDANTIEVLEALVSMYPAAKSLKPRAVINYPTNLKGDRFGGKSNYQVERELIRSRYCLQPTLIGLHDKWPNEVYGIYCKNKPPVSIVCTWGECDFASIYPHQ